MRNWVHSIQKPEILKLCFVILVTPVFLAQLSTQGYLLKYPRWAPADCYIAQKIGFYTAVAVSEKGIIEIVEFGRPLKSNYPIAANLLLRQNSESKELLTDS